jgi:hypothetical protein
MARLPMARCKHSEHANLRRCPFRAQGLKSLWNTSSVRTEESNAPRFTDEEHARWDRNLSALERKWSPFRPDVYARRDLQAARREGRAAKTNPRKKGVDKRASVGSDGRVDSDTNERDAT